MQLTRGQRQWGLVLACGVLVCLGAVVRFHNLGRAPLSTIEVFAPGIDLPPYPFSDPAPRLTLAKVFTGVVAAEPHPPGYYVLLLGWVQWFGTSELALRFPSALVGVASIVLIYVLASRLSGPLTGLIAAAMLALHGYHVYWSQDANRYTLACFFSLASTLCLALLYTPARRPKLLTLLYIVTTLWGLSTSIYFWLVFLAQVGWVGLCHITKKTPAAGLLRWQILLWIAASPLWSIAAYQSRTPSYLKADFRTALYRFFHLGYLFGIYKRSLTSSSVFLVMQIAVFLFVLFFLIYALRSRHRVVAGEIPVRGPHPILMACTCLVVVMAIVVFVILAHRMDPSRTTFILATLALPLGLYTGDVWLRRTWSRIENRLVWCHGAPLLPLHTSLVIVPLLALIGLSLFKPLFAERGTLVFIPYLLITVADGMVACLYRQRVWLVTTLVLLLAIQAFSVRYYQNEAHGTINYKEFYDRWQAKLQPSDVIVVRRHWLITPIFYYFPWRQYRVIGVEQVSQLDSQPVPRVWVLTHRLLRDLPEMQKVLVGYTARETLHTTNLQAIYKDEDLHGKYWTQHFLAILYQRP